ncbi:hypothetical protein, partial [Mesorhizobium sp.]|uniref:hypothetical protein n=2 Tax=unclassified Mesorhizobium TaxID=325217 RepID=UPI0025C54198
MTNSPHHAKRAGRVCFSSPFSTNVPGNALFPTRSSRNGDGVEFKNTFQDRELAMKIQRSMLKKLAFSTILLALPLNTAFA